MNLFKNYGSLLFLLILFVPSNNSCAAVSVTYYSDLITFHFVVDYSIGQFANGDYWVHNNGGNVIVTKISPASRDNGTGRIINGAMINPPDSGSQGYDSSPRDMSYANFLNVDPGNTGAKLVESPGTSIVKTISMTLDAGRPIIKDAVVLWGRHG